VKSEKTKIMSADSTLSRKNFVSRESEEWNPVLRVRRKYDIPAVMMVSVSKDNASQP
jgi:hypothetical protein